MLVRVKLQAGSTVVFEGRALKVDGAAPDIVMHAGALFVAAADAVGDGEEHPILYRQATTAPAIASPADGAEGA